MTCINILKKFPTVVKAKHIPHESVSNKEDWDYLCDRFYSEELKVKFMINNHSKIFLIKYLRYFSIMSVILVLFNN